MALPESLAEFRPSSGPAQVEGARAEEVPPQPAGPDVRFGEAGFPPFETGARPGETGTQPGEAEARTGLPPLAPELFGERRTIPIGIPLLDRFVGGFHPSELSFVDSGSAFVLDLASMLCVEGARGGGEVVFVDGGNSVDPIAIGQLSRLRGLDRGEVLSQVSVARAFTAYQMDALVNERLDEMMRQSGAGTVVVGCLLDPFLDRDVWWSESFQLVKRCVSTLKRLAREHGAAVVATNHGLSKVGRRSALHRLMYATPDKVVRLEATNLGLRVSAPPRDGWTYYRPVPSSQAILDYYFEVCGDGQDRSHL